MFEMMSAGDRNSISACLGWDWIPLWVAVSGLLSLACVILEPQPTKSSGRPNCVEVSLILSHAYLTTSKVRRANAQSFFVFNLSRGTKDQHRAALGQKMTRSGGLRGFRAKGCCRCARACQAWFPCCWQWELGAKQYSSIKSWRGKKNR